MSSIFLRNIPANFGRSGGKYYSAVSAIARQQLVSPAASVWINRFQVDVSAIRPTGKSVRGDALITKGDVLNLLGPNPTIPSSAKKSSTKYPSSPPSIPSMTIAEPAAAAVAGISTSSGGNNASFTDTPVTTVRKVIASRLSESKFSIPHYYVANDCDVTSLVNMRKKITSPDKKVSVNDMIIKASAFALQDMPQVNIASTVDISVAVATDNGLITPIVRDANLKSLSEIGAEVRELAGLARENKLKPEQFQGGSFTISNLGMFGVDAFTSIINPPQGAILAVAKSESRVVVDDASSVPRVASVMTAQLSCDRRVISDDLAAQFMQILRAYLENPELLLL